MPSVDIYNLGEKPVKSPVSVNDSEAYGSYIQGETTVRYGSETHRLEPSLKSFTDQFEIGCLGGKSPRSLERWNNEVNEFQKAKRESLRNAIPDYHQWKQRLRLDLEAELSRRTQEAVQTPPRERLRQMRMDYEARESQRALVGQLHREEMILMQNKFPHDSNVSKQKDLVVKKPNILDPKLHPVARKQQKRRQWELKAHHARELVTVIKPISKEMGEAISNEIFQLEPKDRELIDSTESESDTLRSDESQAINPEKLSQTSIQVDRLSCAPSNSTISEITKRTKAVLQRRRFSIGTCSHWLTGEPPETNRESSGYPRSVGSILSCLCDTEYDGLSWHISSNRQVTGDPFCFEWDASAVPEVYRLSKDFGSLFTDTDKEIMTEIERFAATKRTSFNWTTRQALLQRLQQLTREEKQLFYFSATRAAYLVATTNSHTTLPDGTQMKLGGFDQHWVNNQGRQNQLLSMDSGTKFYSSDGSPTIEDESNHLEADDWQSKEARQVPVLSDWTGVTRDIHGPFWPNGLGPLYPAPVHLRPNSEKKDETQNVSANYSLLRISQATAKLQVTGDPEECLISSWFVPQVVYDRETSARWTSAMLEAMGMSSQLGNPRQFISWIPPSLVFESRFECGNLRQARRIGMFEYELLLSPDLNTNRHVQWFYFAIRNAIPGFQYRFVIVNFSKKESLYKKGMQVLFYSEKQAERNGRGWHRTGQNIKYTENTENRSNPLIQSNSRIYQLLWDQTFPHADDLCYMAYCYPYSFTDLKSDLKELVRQAKTNALPEGTVCCEIMCQTRVGNSCFLVTITDPGVPDWEKIAVILTARVHPGETNSSWVILGLMRSLISNNSEAEFLRRSYVFRIVPMLNPDGVILGNYRCSVTGHDLNRNYRKPQKDVFPTVWHTRELLRQCKLKNMDVIYYDLHGHSRRNNVFTYGCDQSLRKAPNNTDVVNPITLLQDRVLPFLLSKLLPDKFSLTACRFNIQRQKESTSRVVFWREFELTHSFTLETTFNGSNLMGRELKQFDITDFMEVGQSIGPCLLEFHRLYTKPSLMRPMIARIARTFLVHLLKEARSCDAQSGDLETSNQSEENANLTHTQRSPLEQGFENPENGNTAPTSPDESTTSGTIGIKIQSGPHFPTKMTLEDMVDSIRRLEAGRELNTLSAAQEPDESSSSDSNSDSEPELEVGAQNELLFNVDETKGFEILKTQCKLTAEPVSKRTNGGKKIKGKVGRSGRSHGTGLGKRSFTLPCLKSGRRCNTESSGEISDLSRENSGAESARKNVLTQKRKNELKKLEAGSNFVGKYDGKTNNGIPCFVEKRLLERACQKLYHVWQKTDFTNYEDVRLYWRCIDYVESTLKMALLFETTEKDEEDYRQFLERLSLIKTKTQERLEALSVDTRAFSQTFLSPMPVWQNSVANNFESDRIRLICSGYSNLSSNTSYNPWADAESMH